MGLGAVMVLPLQENVWFFVFPAIARAWKGPVKPGSLKLASALVAAKYAIRAYCLATGEAVGLLAHSGGRRRKFFTPLRSQPHRRRNPAAG